MNELELDAYIAEKVMGWVIHPNADPDSPGTYYDDKADKFWYTVNGYSPTTDANLALAAIDNLCDSRGWDWEVETQHHEGKKEYWCWILPPRGRAPGRGFRGDTPAMAICLAIQKVQEDTDAAE